MVQLPSSDAVALRVHQVFPVLHHCQAAWFVHVLDCMAGVHAGSAEGGSSCGKVDLRHWAHTACGAMMGHPSKLAVVELRRNSCTVAPLQFKPVGGACV